LGSHEKICPSILIIGKIRALEQTPSRGASGFAGPSPRMGRLSGKLARSKARLATLES